MKTWPIGGRLPRLTRDDFARMTVDERIDYHLERAAVYGARARFALRIAIVVGVVALVLTVITVL